MEPEYYTLAVWRVQPGRDAEFVEAWKGLGEAFAGLHRRPVWGTLLQSLLDPSLYYSFGPWRSLEDIEAMMSDPRAQEAIQRVRDLCVEATPGPFRMIAHVEV